MSFSFKNLSLENVFKEIETKTNYRFIYTKEELKNAAPVSIDIVAGTIERVLEKIFQNQPLSYTINKNYISIFKDDKKGTASAPLNTTVIEGKVLDEKNEPVIRATVQARNANIYTSTDKTGSFQLRNVSPNDVLLISSVGFVSKEIPVAGKNMFITKLDYAIKELEETIIKGYYSTTKRLNTGAVSKVSGEELSKQPISNPLAGLHGRAPGLFIRQSNGLPGSNFSVLIRGQNSLRSGTDPLYIIDGVPFPLSFVSQMGLSLNSNNPFNTIPISDIESIEILKDADAIAIYGSRGANGVILITTKKANDSKTAVEINFYQGWGKITRQMDYFNTEEYLMIRREAFKNDGIQPTIANAPDLLAWDTTRYTDWRKLLIGGTAKFTNAHIRYSAGTANTKFTLNNTFYRETTVFPSDFRDLRGSTSLSVNQIEKSGKFQANFSTSYAHEDNNLATQDLSSVINLPPNAPPIYDSLGRLNWSEGGVNYQNPFGMLLRTYNGKSRRWTSSLNLTYSPVQNFRIKLNGGYNNFLFDETTFNPIKSLNPANNPTGSASFGNSDFTGWIFEPQLDYRLSTNKAGQLEALIGTSYQVNNTNKKLINGSGYTDDGLLRSISGAATVRASNSFSEYKYQAVFTRINYNYEDKYLVNLTGRRDGSSRFGPGEQFANFGAIGLGWLFHKEKWIKSSIPFLSYGKLRGSYGTSGNDQIGDYQFLDTWSTTQYTYGGSIGLRPTRLFNTDYSWELNKKLNFGLEAAILENRISLDIDWYRNLSKKQIISYSLPGQSGFTSIVQNFPGEVENKGWELQLKGNPVRNKNLQWNSSFNISIPVNKLSKFPDLESSSFANSYRVGKPINARIGYIYLGIDPVTGVYQFEDINKDNLYNIQDYVYLGTTNPIYYGGFLNSISYRNINFEFLFQFVNQKNTHPILSGFKLLGGRENFPVMMLDRWAKPGDVTSYQKATQMFGTPATNAALLVWQSDAAIVDASYIRLKNVSLSYDLKPILFRNLSLERALLFVKAQNLLTITNFVGNDPENISGLPMMKVLTVGTTINF